MPAEVVQVADTNQHNRARRAIEHVYQELKAQLRRAEAVLRSLETAKQETERDLAADNREDPMKTVTGRSAIESAIDSTRAMIDRLRRALAEAQRLLTSPEPIPAGAPADLRVALHA